MKYILTILSLCFALMAFAIDKDPVRIEIKSDLENDNYNVVPCSKYGVLVFYQSVNMYSNQERVWLFTLFDQKLKRKKKFEVPVIEGVYYQGYIRDSLGVYLIFYNNDRVKSGVFNLQVLKYDFISEDFDVLKALAAEKANLIDGEVINDKVFLGFDLKKHNIDIYMADFRNNVFKNLNFENVDRNLLEDIYADKISGDVKVIINNFYTRKENQLLVVTYDSKGNEKGRCFIKASDPDIELNSARMISLNADQQLVIGTYNNAASHSSDLKNEDEIVSAGVYISRMNENQQDYLKYYNFLDFKNFNAYVSASRVFRLKKKSGKSSDRDYSLNYRLLLHDIMKNGDEYILLAEAYYPEYRTVSYITYDYYGRPFPQTYTVFEGFKFFSGIITGFNPDGKLLWDNGIKIWDIVSFKLEKRVEAFFDKNDLVLAYNNQGKIAYEIYDQGEVIGDFEYVDIQKRYGKDKLIDEANSNLIKWYDKYFLCVGYQEIRNNALADNEKREVFYMNKVAFD